MNTESADKLLSTLESLCHDLAHGRPSNADALFELTKSGNYPDQISRLAESFGMMLVKVEAREFKMEQVIDDLRKAKAELGRAKKQLARENAGLKKSLSRKYSPVRILGHSIQMRNVLDQCERIADTPVSVLITGPTGTGKELVAKALHYNSYRKTGPFISINCSAIPETLFESELFGIEKGVATGVDKRVGKLEEANGGTLFLDEIGDMPAAGQAKLLRVLEERELTRVGHSKPIPLDIRVVAATNKDLHEEVEEDRFREDLYYRLNVVHIKLPPLRERKDDITLLLRSFLDNHVKNMSRPKMRFTPEAMECLKRYPWPGNVRELDNEVERLVALAYSDVIDVSDLSDRIKKHAPKGPVAKSDKETVDDLLNSDLKTLEIKLIKRTLLETDNNKTEAANRLGISREGLRKKMLRYDLE